MTGEPIAPQRWVPTIDRDLLYYLSGPMSGYEDFNYPAFEDATQILRNTGLKIKSAHETFAGQEHTPGMFSWEEYMRKDIEAMLQCGGIILLKGWPTSKGARIELEIALDLSFPVYFYHDYMLTDMNKAA